MPQEIQRRVEFPPKTTEQQISVKREDAKSAAATTEVARATKQAFFSQPVDNYDDVSNALLCLPQSIKMTAYPVDNCRLQPRAETIACTSNERMLASFIQQASLASSCSTAHK